MKQTIVPLGYVLLTVILLNSCLPAFVLPNSMKGFDVYKHKVKDSAATTVLKMDGLYISETGSAFAFFYKNGKVKLVYSLFQTKSTMQRPEEAIQYTRKYIGHERKDHWGEYEIRGEKIKIQYFNRNLQEIPKRWVLEAQGKVVNDSTIDIYFHYSMKGISKLEQYDPPCRLHFYPLDIKADSTKVWYNKKGWYRHSVNKSRID